MVIKGLPVNFKTFSTAIMQKEVSLSFKYIKEAFRNFEETEKSYINSDDNLMMVIRNAKNGTGNVLTCFVCGKVGHKKTNCPNLNTGKLCGFHKSQTHNTENCRGKHKPITANFVSDGSDVSHSYVFKMEDWSKSNLPIVSRQDDMDFLNVDKNAHCLLVDCGVTSHIMNDIGKFVNIDKNFNSNNHCIELDDGRKNCGVVKAKGNANVVLHDRNCSSYNIQLDEVLCIPSYKQDIFSIHKATEYGSSIIFTPNYGALRAPDGNIFDIKKEDKLY